MPGQPGVRAVTPDDREFLEDMLSEAFNWDPARRAMPRDELRSVPSIIHYVTGWPRPGDLGVIAEVDRLPVGAVWIRLFSIDDPGFGFVEAAIPELSIAVASNHRGQGIGTLLMQDAEAAALSAGHDALSLSVERSNPAAAWYRAIGYRHVASDIHSDTLIKRLDKP